MSNIQTIGNMAPAIKYQTNPKRYYFDVALGSILLSGEDTGRAYCLLDLRSRLGKACLVIHTRARMKHCL